MHSIKSFIKRIQNTTANSLLRKRIHNLDFTILSIDCWGGSIYQDLSLPYNTPFVGLFLKAPCFLQLLGNLDHYLDSPLVFISASRYPSVNEERQNSANFYPIGQLGVEVELHFLHYADQAEAEAKWKTRLVRMKRDTLFIEFSDRNLCTEDHLQEFDRLMYPHKVVFTAKPHPNLRSAVWLPEYSGRSEIVKIYASNYIYKRHFDLANWLNGGNGKAGVLYRVFNRLLEVRSES
jgi:uncharacterized protein (DUF1919 family)